MAVVTKTVACTTRGDAECIDITAQVRLALEESGLSDGIVTVFVPGATGALSTVEYESGLISDMEELWDKLVPSGRSYHHDRAWGYGNGHSHLRATLLGPSLTVPFVAGSLTLGIWQQVIFIDFDVRPRKRELVVQIMGE